MNWLKRKLEKWREERHLEAKRCGYDYAAGQILRGYPAVAMQAEYECTDPTVFDAGMEDAVDQAVKNGWIKDDRI